MVCFKKNLLCSKSSLTNIVAMCSVSGYQQPSCLCARTAFVVGTISLSREFFFTLMQLLSFMCGRHQHNCVREVVFRFARVASECSAVEFASLAQNIPHISAGVRLHLVVVRCF